MEVFFTIITGVLIFVLSQYFLELILKPYIKYKNTLVRIDNKLRFYRQAIFNRNKELLDKNKKRKGLNPVAKIFLRRILDAEVEFRDLSCSLESNYKNLNNHFIIRKSSKKDIREASEILMLIANSIFSDGEDEQEIEKNINKLRRLLQIPEIDQ